MSLGQSAKLNGHDWQYLRGVLARLPTHLNSRIEELLQHRWRVPANQRHMKNIEALIDNGGEITLGAIGSIQCAATAADDHNAMAMLVRREGETLNALLKRLDKAIAKFYEDGTVIDEINDPAE